MVDRPQTYVIINASNEGIELLVLKLLRKAKEKSKMGVVEGIFFNKHNKLIMGMDFCCIHLFIRYSNP